MLSHRSFESACTELTYTDILHHHHPTGFRHEISSSCFGDAQKGNWECLAFAEYLDRLARCGELRHTQEGRRKRVRRDNGRLSNLCYSIFQFRANYPLPHASRRQQPCFASRTWSTLRVARQRDLDSKDSRVLGIFDLSFGGVETRL